MGLQKKTPAATRKAVLKVCPIQDGDQVTWTNNAGSTLSGLVERRWVSMLDGHSVRLWIRVPGLSELVRLDATEVEKL